MNHTFIYPISLIISQNYHIIKLIWKTPPYKYSMLTITDNAAKKIQDILAEENNPAVMLRTFVQGGGCSGFSYGFTLDEEQHTDDFVVESQDIKVLVDSMSMTYLEGAVIDYTETLQGSQFTIVNPNATSTCGCGSSFSVE